MHNGRGNGVLKGVDNFRKVYGGGSEVGKVS